MEWLHQLGNGEMLRLENGGVLSRIKTGYPYPDTGENQSETLYKFYHTFVDRNISFDNFMDKKSDILNMIRINLPLEGFLHYTKVFNVKDTFSDEYFLETSYISPLTKPYINKTSGKVLLVKNNDDIAYCRLKKQNNAVYINQKNDTKFDSMEDCILSWNKKLGKLLGVSCFLEDTVICNIFKKIVIANYDKLLNYYIEELPKDVKEDLIFDFKNEYKKYYISLSVESFRLVCNNKKYYLINKNIVNFKDGIISNDMIYSDFFRSKLVSLNRNLCGIDMTDIFGDRQNAMLNIFFNHQFKYTSPAKAQDLITYAISNLHCVDENKFTKSLLLRGNIDIVSELTNSSVPISTKLNYFILDDGGCSSLKLQILTDRDYAIFNLFNIGIFYYSNKKNNIIVKLPILEAYYNKFKSNFTEDSLLDVLRSCTYYIEFILCYKLFNAMLVGINSISINFNNLHIIQVEQIDDSVYSIKFEV